MERQIITHSLESDNVVIIYPGYNGTADGYSGKYRKIAEFLVARKVGAVVRTDNHLVPNVPYEQSVKDHIREVILYAGRNSEEICGLIRPNLFLMGISAGAGTIAAVAHEYECIKKILLIAPSADAGRKSIIEGISRYTGEVYVLVGDSDEIVGVPFPHLLFNKAKTARRKEFVVVEGCDHQFCGEKNSRILSQAPIWAFVGDRAFPDPQGGIKLYD